MDNKKLYYNLTSKIEKEGRKVDPAALEGFKNFCFRQNNEGIMEHTYDEFTRWLDIWDMAENDEVVFDIEIHGKKGHIEAMDNRANIRHIFNF